MPEGVAVQGEVLEVSGVPDPAKSDYPDCNYTVKFTVKHNKTNIPVPQNVQLILPAFRKNKLVNESKFRKGDLLSVTLVDFDKAPEKEKSIQQADDFNDVTAEQFYGFKAKKIKELPTFRNELFSEAAPYISPFDMALNPPLSDELKKISAENIRRDLDRINGIIEKYENCGGAKAVNSAFLSMWEQHRNNLQKHTHVISPFPHNPGGTPVKLPVSVYMGKYGKGYFSLPENYILCNNRPGKIPQRNIDGIKSVRDLCHANGVEFIVLVLPKGDSVAARMLNPEFRDVPMYQEMYISRCLLENGIECVLPEREILAAAGEWEFAYHYPSDYHPSLGCVVPAVQTIAKRLGRFGLKRDLSPDVFAYEGQDTGWLANFRYEYYDQSKKVMNDILKVNGKFFASDETSPVLLLTNSTGVPQKFNTSGVYLSRELGKNIHAVHRSGGHGLGIDIPVTMFYTPQKCLSGKRVCIMVVYAGHLEAYWFLDLHELDRKKRLLEGKKTVFEYKLTGKKLQSKSEAWEKLKQGYTDFFETEVSRKKGDYALFEVEVPADKIVASKPLLLRFNAAFSGGGLELAVNGKAVYFHTWAGMQDILVEFKEIPEKITFSYKTFAPFWGGYLLVKDVQFFQ